MQLQNCPIWPVRLPEDCNRTGQRDPDPGRRIGKVRSFQWKSNKGPFRWPFSETQKNSLRDVGHRRWTKRSSPAFWRISEKAPIRNANLWAFLLGNNTVSENRSLVCQVQDGRAQTWKHYEDPSTDDQHWWKKRFQIIPPEKQLSPNWRKPDNQGTK